MVVNHPVRRRIIRDLILMGNIGLTSALATLIVVAVQTSGFQGILGTIGWLAAGAALLFVLARIGFLKRALDRVIRYSLSRVGMVRAMDYELLLRAKDGFCISEIEMLEGNPLVGKRLGESRPADKGLIVLGILKGGEFHGAPGPNHRIDLGDVVTVYGREDAVTKLAKCCEPEHSGKNALSRCGIPSGPRLIRGLWQGDRRRGNSIWKMIACRTISASVPGRDLK
ncbi:MAG: TrkA C-terminal domain-containing protein [Verrucomicrobiales bacterium]